MAVFVGDLVSLFGKYSSASYYAYNFGSSFVDDLDSSSFPSSSNKPVPCFNIIKTAIETILSLFNLSSTRVSFFGHGLNDVNERVALKSFNASLDMFVETMQIEKEYGRATKGALIYGVGVLKIGLGGIRSLTSDNIFVLRNELGCGEFTYVKKVNNLTNRELVYRLSLFGLSCDGYVDSRYSFIEEYDTLEKTFKVFVNSSLVYSEIYDCRLPYVFLIWNREDGFVPYGIPHELLVYQSIVNTINSSIVRAIYLSSISTVFVPQGDVSTMSGMKNLNSGGGVNMIATPTGKAPQIGMTISNMQEMISYLQFVLEQAFQVIGLSQTSVSGDAPPSNIRSATALGMYYQKRDARYLSQQENFLTQIKNLMMSFVSILGSSSIIAKPFLKLSAFGDIDFRLLNECLFDKFTMSVGQTTDMPTNISGRIDIASTLLQMGIPQDDVFGIIGIVDLDHLTYEKQMRRLSVELFVDDVIGGRVSPVISDEMDLAYLQRHCQVKIIEEKIKKKPDFDVVGNLGILINEASKRLSEVNNLGNSGNVNNADNLQVRNGDFSNSGVNDLNTDVVGGNSLGLNVGGNLNSGGAGNSGGSLNSGVSGGSL